MLKENRLYYSKLISKCDLHEYISEESIEDIRREIRFKHDSEAVLYSKSGQT
jgi:hypothetical protein